MKKLVLFLCALTTFNLFGVSQDKASLEARVGYLGFVNSVLKDTYNQGGANYELIGTIPMKNHFQAWVAVDYFYKSGKSGGISTNIQIIPATVGPKYMYPLGNYTPYIGAGFKYLWVIVHNDSDLVAKSISKNGPGGVVETGCQFNKGHFVADLFFNYTFAWMSKPEPAFPNIQTTNLDVSTWNLGGGIGYRF